MNEVEKEIVRLRREGRTLEDIRLDVRCSHSFVLNTLTKYYKTPKEELQERRDLIKELRSKGHTAAEVAELTGCGISYVYEVSKERGL